MAASQLATYSLSGYRRMRQAPIAPVAARRTPSRSAISPRSSSSSGVTVWKPSTNACDDRMTSSPSRPQSTDASVEETSQSSAVWLMSPKSTIPVTRPRSSTSALSSVRSPWITWARSPAHRGSTCSSKRSSTRSTSTRRRGSSIDGTSDRSAGACRTSQGRARPAAGWKKPRRARPRRGHHDAEVPQRVAVQLGRVDGAPARHVLEHPHVMRSVARRRRHGRAVRGRARGGGRARNHPRRGHGQLGVDARDQERRFGLHVEDRRLLGGVRDLEHPPRTASVVDQEVLIPLAAQLRSVAPEPEDVERDPQRLLGAEHRRIGLERVAVGTIGEGRDHRSIVAHDPRVALARSSRYGVPLRSRISPPAASSASDPPQDGVRTT